MSKGGFVMNILAIGNSFSQDATRYLHGIAKSAGAYLTVVNLEIGGCPLEKHFRNIKADAKAYAFEFNGEYTGFQLSIKEALVNRSWDVITIQQVSTQSPKYETYQPYLNFCVDYFREYCPKAKIYIQQVWSYENGGPQLTGWTKYSDTEEMFADVKASYAKALEDSGADGLIRSGEVMLELMKGGFKVHRDGFHASLGLARYAIALTWYATLTGRNVDDVTFGDFDVPVSDEEIAAAKAAVKKVLGL